MTRLIKPILLLKIITLATHAAEMDLDEYFTFTALPLEIQNVIVEKLPENKQFLTRLTLSQVNKNLQKNFNTLYYQKYFTANQETINTFLTNLAQSLGAVPRRQMIKIRENILDERRSLITYSTYGNLLDNDNLVPPIEDFTFDFPYLYGRYLADHEGEKQEDGDLQQIPLEIKNRLLYVPELLIALLLNWPSTQAWIEAASPFAEIMDESSNESIDENSNEISNKEIINQPFDNFIDYFTLSVIAHGGLIVPRKIIKLSTHHLEQLIKYVQKELLKNTSDGDVKYQDSVNINLFLSTVIFGDPVVQKIFLNDEYATLLKDRNDPQTIKKIISLSDTLYQSMLERLSNHIECSSLSTMSYRFIAQVYKLLQTSISADDYTLFDENTNTVLSQYPRTKRLINTLLLLNRFIAQLKDVTNTQLQENKNLKRAPDEFSDEENPLKRRKIIT
ncbi:hypothetical protein J120_02465 [candidate division TM6 bacterium JCVI TM6SC1]|uniref:F-box domain-containing protein n=1 Tax=candidate division TM6 bacterium JCVI TM6SC1 TaxID=1306947 RepID=A0A0D2JDV3_9BACT|nr:hypothetical protein J120_02465 [candidate division TM6 bacterium JCVI TM6SC1]